MNDVVVSAEFTPAWAIRTTLEIRERRAKRTSEYKKAEKADRDKEDLLEQFLLRTMFERGEEQIKTADGTAYKSPQMRAVMADRQAVISHVVDEVEKGNLSAFDIFTNHVSKEYVAGLIDADIQPPGVEVTFFMACNVRSA